MSKLTLSISYDAGGNVCSNEQRACIVYEERDNNEKFYFCRFVRGIPFKIYDPKEDLYGTIVRDTDFERVSENCFNFVLDYLSTGNKTQYNNAVAMYQQDNNVTRI